MLITAIFYLYFQSFIFISKNPALVYDLQSVCGDWLAVERCTGIVDDPTHVSSILFINSFSFFTYELNGFQFIQVFLSLSSHISLIELKKEVKFCVGAHIMLLSCIP